MFKGRQRVHPWPSSPSCHRETRASSGAGSRPPGSVKSAPRCKRPRRRTPPWRCRASTSTSPPATCPRSCRGSASPTSSMPARRTSPPSPRRKSSWMPCWKRNASSFPRQVTAAPTTATWNTGKAHLPQQALHLDCCGPLLPHAALLHGAHGKSVGGGLVRILQRGAHHLNAALNGGRGIVLFQGVENTG